MVDKMRVVIIDDHPLFRQGVAEALADTPDIEVIAEGSSAQDAVQLVSHLAPDVLLLDADILGGGLGAAEAVADHCPTTKIVILTESREDEHLLAALRAGARAYVLKEVSGPELVTILRGVRAGEAYVTPARAVSVLIEMTAARRAGQAPDDFPSARPLEKLTERERQILDLVASGLSNREIGQQLRLTEKTVKHHMTSILHKLHVRGRVQAALLLQRGDHRAE